MIRYTLANLFVSQRFVAPTFLYLALLAVLTSNDSGPLVGVYAATAGSLLAAAVWIAVAVANAEDPAARWVALANARRTSDVTAATAVAALLYEAALGIVGLLYPLVSGHHTVSASALGIGAAAELTCAAVGTGLGLLCARPVIVRTGVSTLTGIALVLSVLLIKELPPVSPMLRRMTGGSSVRAAVPNALPFLGFAILGVAALYGCGVVAHRLGRRRD
ncbi:MAG: hypothetical protein AUG49_21855 [Catenulispora sp. 13_1_20CM_3_70_7]|nr:MAG: hypothetical protein AUG49_21855 [Catenulispora sp. 13_1_20CM_3_70_7]